MKNFYPHILGPYKCSFGHHSGQDVCSWHSDVLVQAWFQLCAFHLDFIAALQKNLENPNQVGEKWPSRTIVHSQLILLNALICLKYIFFKKQLCFPLYFKSMVGISHQHFIILLS